MAVKALLLAAGLGTRLRPYTLRVPKPCIPFWGLPIMYYSFFLLKKTQVRNVAVNLHHLPDEIKKLLASANLSDFNIQFSLEKDKPYGSGGAIHYAQNFLQDCEHFFAINSDEVMVPSETDILNRLHKHHVSQKALATLLVTDHPELMKTFKPVWVDQQGLVRGFGEKPHTTDPLKPVHYTGYKIFSREILKKIPPGETNIFHDILKKEIAAGARVATLHDTCAWWETGNYQALLTAMGEVMEHPEYQNYILEVYKEFGFDYNFEIARTATSITAKDKRVELSNVDTQGIVFLDRGSQIAAGSRLENAIIGRGAQSASLSNQMLLPGESSC